jgi:hypothetical protein
LNNLPAHFAQHEYASQPVHPVNTIEYGAHDYVSWLLTTGGPRKRLGTAQADVAPGLADFRAFSRQPMIYYIVTALVDKNSAYRDMKHYKLWEHTYGDNSKGARNSVNWPTYGCVCMVLNFMGIPKRKWLTQRQFDILLNVAKQGYSLAVCCSAEWYGEQYATFDDQGRPYKPHGQQCEVDLEFIREDEK